MGALPLFLAKKLLRQKENKTGEILFCEKTEFSMVKCA